MSIPALPSTAAGTIFGAVDGANRTFTAPYFNPLGQMVFWNGDLLTWPLDYTSSGFTLTLTQAPGVGDVVTEAAFDRNLNTVALPLNAPTLYNSVNGTLTGTIDGVNNVFVVATGLLVTDLIVFWNGVMQTESVDYTWTCLQNSSAGPWVTTITMMAGQYPNPGDIMTAEVFGS